MNNNNSTLLKQILEISKSEAERLNSQIINCEHILLAALKQNNGLVFKILKQLNLPIDQIIKDIEEHLDLYPINEQTTTFEDKYEITSSAVRYLQLAISEARKINMTQVGGEHIILALLHDDRAMDSEFLKHIKNKYLNFDISISSVDPTNLPKFGKNFTEDDDDDEILNDKNASEQSSSSPFKSRKSEGGNGNNSATSDTPALDKFGYDMTKAAREGKLDPVIGRNTEIERLAQILSRRKKNNPVLIGEPGVGKTAVVEGLAEKIIEGEDYTIVEGKYQFNLSDDSKLYYSSEDVRYLDKNLLSHLKTYFSCYGSDSSADNPVWYTAVGKEGTEEYYTVLLLSYEEKEEYEDSKDEMKEKLIENEFTSEYVENIFNRMRSMYNLAVYDKGLYNKYINTYLIGSIPEINGDNGDYLLSFMDLMLKKDEFFQLMDMKFGPYISSELVNYYNTLYDKEINKVYDLTINGSEEERIKNADAWNYVLNIVEIFEKMYIEKILNQG